VVEEVWIRGPGSGSRPLVEAVTNRIGSMHEDAGMLLEDLTDAQRDAVTTMDGPLLVLAGPGSGKTTVVARRMAWLIAHGVPPWRILALTFTNKAAGAMRDRVDLLLQQRDVDSRDVTCMTYHGFCARVLRQYADAAGVPPGFSIYDTTDRRSVLKQAIRKAELDPANWTPASVGESISSCKSMLVTADVHEEHAGGDFYSRTIGRVYRAYEEIMHANDALDFDDLLMRMALMLREDAAVRDTLQDRYRHLMIDEYQDTNHAQFLIATSLVGPQRNICVVGDPDQSIYAWRGADVRNILEFEEHFPNAKVVPLGRNFRSTGHVVAASAQLIGHNASHMKKELHTQLEDGPRVLLQPAGDEHEEASSILAAFKEHASSGIQWSEMAVLYRINALSRVLEQAFRDGGVPYVVARGTAFYERAEIKDALAYLRLVVNRNDDTALRRVINSPPRGIGKTSLSRVEQHAMFGNIRLGEALRDAGQINNMAGRAARSIAAFVEMIDRWRSAADGGSLIMDLPDLVTCVIRESGLEQAFRTGRGDEDMTKLENLDELVTAAAEWTPPPGDGSSESATILEQLAAWLESIALVSDADMVDPERGVVTLMTLHAAKGLEFDVVAIAGLEQGLLPHGRSIGEENGLEEERRLCYVGMTRARKHLSLTWAHRRTVRGITERAMPSQFLGELPDDAIERAVDHDPWSGGRSAVPDTNWKVGMTVRHPTFGLGVVRRVIHRPRGTTATVDFLEYGQRTLLVAHAKLECVDPEERPWEGIDVPL